MAPVVRICLPVGNCSAADLRLASSEPNVLRLSVHSSADLSVLQASGLQHGSGFLDVLPECAQLAPPVTLEIDLNGLLRLGGFEESTKQIHH